MPTPYPKQLRDRAVRMVIDHLDEYESPFQACKAIAPKVGVAAETLRRWVRQALIDQGMSPGVKTVEKQRIKDLERQVRDLKEANEILKAASVFFARELDPRHQ